MTPLKEQAYQHLLNLITTNQLTYQKIYSETQLSREIGISRTPFRDAVHRLAQEGYIDIIPSKGFTLHQLSSQDINETFQIRSALECYCTLQLAKNTDAPDVRKLFKELQEIMANLKRIIDTTHSIKEFCEYDFQFHTKIVEHLGNEQFFSIFSAYMYRMKRLAGLSLEHEGRMEDAYDEHMNILRTMEAGDSEHIIAVTLRHMDTPRYINLDDL